MKPTGPWFAWLSRAIIAAHAGDEALVPPNTAHWGNGGLELPAGPRNDSGASTPPWIAALKDTSGVSLPSASTVLPSRVGNLWGRLFWYEGRS